MHHSLCLAGIDFGAKTAGTTVIAVLQQRNNSLELSYHMSIKGRDADAFVEEGLCQYNPSVVCIDAPLTLPGVYRGLPGCSDYFFRRCDLELRAMSPMFLGGLTARAMRLAHRMKSHNVPLLETYPAELARRFHLKDYGYKSATKALSTVLSVIRAAVHDEERFSAVAVSELLQFSRQVPLSLPTWHHVDALLALVSALRVTFGVNDTIGDAREGVIVV
jgi:predicted nuclease with RNAse H fold